MNYIRIFLILIVGLEIYYYIDFLSYSYPAFIEMVMNKFHNTFLIDMFPYLFTEQKFDLLHIVIPIMLSIQCLGIAMLYKFKSVLSKKSTLLIVEIKECKKIIILSLKSLTLFQKIFLFLIATIIIFSRIFLIGKYPFSGDEALSYFTFVNNGFLLTISFYPEPNNHIFYNLVEIIFNQFIKNPIYVMRVPNVIFDILLLGMGFLYLLKKQNYTTAILFLIIAGFSFSSMIYAIHGRGYILISLFTLITFIASIELIENPKSKLAFSALITSSILGIFTIPIFLFIFVGLAVFLGYSFLLQKRYADLKLVLAYVLYVNIGWIALYLPTFCVSEITINHLIVQHSDLWYYFSFIVPVSCVEAINYILGTYSKGYYLMGLLILFILYTYRKANSNFLEISLRMVFISICSFIFFMLVKRIFGEFRTFTMYSFLFALILSVCLSYWINKIKKQLFVNTLLISIALFYMLLIPITFEKKIKDIDQITSGSPSTIFVTVKSHLFYLMLYNINQHKNIKLYTQNSKKNLPFDYVIVKDSTEIPVAITIKNYNLVNTDPRMLIFKKR
jgi:hypothetical protein